MSVPWDGPDAIIFQHLAEIREESTKETAVGHAFIRRLAEEQFGRPNVSVRVLGGIMWLWVERDSLRYLIEVHSQPPAFGLGDLRRGVLTGTSPSRLRYLAQLSTRVYLVFPFPSAKTVTAAWFHQVRQPGVISRTRHQYDYDGRVGWTKSDLGGEKDLVTFRLPELVPETPSLAVFTDFGGNQMLFPWQAGLG